MTTASAPALEDPVVQDAADQALSALLMDRDVAEILSLEGGMLEVLRRGKRERLDAILEGPLFALLREAGAESDVVEVKLRNGHRLFAGPLADGRLSLRVVKAPSLDVTIDALVEEGMLPPGIALELGAALEEGAGLLVIGPSRVGRQRAAIAVAKHVQQALGVAAILEGTPLASVPLSHKAPLEHRVEAATKLGADVLFGLELSVRDVAAIARARPSLPLLASVPVPSMDALNAALEASGIPVNAVAGSVAVIGHAPDGRPRLVELHGPTRAGDAPSGREEATGETAPMRALSDAHGPHAGPNQPANPYARASVDDDRDAPPGHWAKDNPDLDPGWELADENASAPPAPGSFDAALQSQRGPERARPTFVPRPPREHPQAGKLKRGDPFGGLTFEPPPGGPAGDDVEPDVPADDEGDR